MATFLKQVENSITTSTETSSSKQISGSKVVYTLADRTDTTSKEGNYFSSFNLPSAMSSMSSGSTISEIRPEIFQLNVDKIVLIQISKNDYSEYIDGRSITINVPQWGGSTTKIVSAFFSEPDGNVKKRDDSVLGKNVAFLFSDSINLPYTGTTEQGSVNKSNVSTWDPTTDFKDRPNATSYMELSNDDKNSDSRPWSSVNTAVYVPENYPDSLDQGYNYDIPVGFVALDKGYVVLTHPDIVDNIPWTSGSTVYIGGYNDANAGEAVITGGNSGASSATTNIVFTSVTSNVTYTHIQTNYQTSVVCIAMPREFFISTNPTWDIQANLDEIANETYNLDSIYVTQIGLYNIEGDLIAVAKLDRPMEKTYSNLLTFNLNIQV